LGDSLLQRTQPQMPVSVKSNANTPIAAAPQYATRKE
jgi:hypothetical protein